MKATVTIECANSTELKHVARALPTQAQLQAAVLYPEDPEMEGLPPKARELRQAKKDRDFWRIQARKFARRIKVLERAAKKAKR